ncbi:hypothetical protein LEMLEM_LOCUS10269, partial [Lemmus lemmus]
PGTGAATGRAGRFAAFPRWALRGRGQRGCREGKVERVRLPPRHLHGPLPAAPRVRRGSGAASPSLRVTKTVWTDRVQCRCISLERCSDQFPALPSFPELVQKNLRAWRDDSAVKSTAGCSCRGHRFDSHV